MSDSVASPPHRLTNPLFRSVSPASSSHSHDAPHARDPPPAKKRPRFLGDSDDDDDGGDAQPRSRPLNADEQRRIDSLFEDDDDVNEATNGVVTDRDKDTDANKEQDKDDEQGVWDKDDEDGKSTKTRRVMPKIDEDRLLGPNGLPKLKSDLANVRFKGKGHEVGGTPRKENRTVF
jgi:replication fork protection complex subunit Csm3/Swi3